ncbi:MAG: glutamate--tRNA ligase [Desulfurococcaceae archaeon TW002]
MSEETIPPEIRKLIKGLTLKNAYEHGGRAVEGPIISAVLGEHPELKPLARDIAKYVAQVVKEVNSLSIEDQKKLLMNEFPELLEEKKEKEEKKRLPPLPQADQYRVIRTRFAPNPDFYIHLGNARPAILSYEYARMYGGVMILRFEDTDPRIKTPVPEAYKQIKEDLKWLGIEWDEEYIQSLRMKLYYEIAEELLRRGAAYVDLCSQKVFRELRLRRVACPHRNVDPQKNLEFFDKMRSGYFSEGEAVLRIKTDLNYPDFSVVDWVAFRIIDTGKHPHPILGSKYVVWPTYNFAAGVDDHLMGITHILRGREHSLNTIKQRFVYQHLGWIYPVVLNLGRLNLEGLILSKSKIKELISSRPGEFDGPSDIRFGTIASLRNRGIEAQTIREVIMDVGIKQSDASISWDNIAALNRKLIDKNTKRLMAVFTPIELRIPNYSGPDKVVLANHPENSSLGSREVSLDISTGELQVLIDRRDLEEIRKTGMFRLMELCNVKATDVREDTIIGEYLGRDLKQAKEARMPIIQWVPARNNVKLKILVPEDLKLRRIDGLGEPALRELEQGDKAQLVRYGFVKIRKKALSKEDFVEALFMHE